MLLLDAISLARFLIIANHLQHTIESASTLDQLWCLGGTKASHALVRMTWVVDRLCQRHLLTPCQCRAASFGAEAVPEPEQVRADA